MDTEKKEKKETKEINKLSLLVVAVVVLALIVGGSVYYILHQRKQIDEMTQSFDLEKEMMEDDLNEISLQYEGYKFNVSSDSLAALLTTEQAKVQRLMEELRTRDGASWRSTMKLLQALGKGTRYEHRNLIGYLDGLKSFEHDALERFYHKWYRPDYQAIIIVGDLDAEATEARLKEMMADIPAPAADAPQKEVIVVPDNEEPIVSIFTDPEMQGSRVQIFVKRPALPEEMNDKVAAEIINITEAYMSTMENARLQEIAMQPDAPFLGAGMGTGDVIGIIPTLNATVFTAMTQDGQLARGMEAIYTEMEKVARHGFTQGEFERAQENLMRQVERSYANRNDRTNSQFVSTYLSNYRKNSPMPDAETEWRLDSMIIKMLNVDVINAYAREVIQPGNQVIVVTAPEKEGVVNPTEEEVLAIRNKVMAAEIEAYEDDVVKEPLIPEGTVLKGSPVKKTEVNDTYGATVWTLANGTQIVFKPTTFKADNLADTQTFVGAITLVFTDINTGEVFEMTVPVSALTARTLPAFTTIPPR